MQTKLFKEVSAPKWWKAENKGASIEGELTGRVLLTFDTREVNAFVFDNAGIKTYVYYTALENKLSPLVGKYVKVEYIGDVKGKNNRTYKDFKVFIAD